MSGVNFTLLLGAALGSVAALWWHSGNVEFVVRLRDIQADALCRDTREKQPNKILHSLCIGASTL